MSANLDELDEQINHYLHSRFALKFKMFIF